MQTRNKKIVAFLVVAFVLGIGKVYGLLEYLPFFKSASEKTIPTESKVVHFRDGQCSPLNQTDTDVLFNQPAEDEKILFSGCDGFF